VSADLRPIRLLGHHALAALEARVQAALEGEVAAWLQPHVRPVALQLRAPQRDDAGSRGARDERDGHAGGDTPGDPVAGDGSSAASSPAFERFEGAHGTLWIRRRPVDRWAWLRASLGEAFCTGDDAPADAWAAAVAEQGWGARNDALCEALTGPASSKPADGPDEALYALGSGAVQIEAAALGLFALADAGVLRHVPPRAVAALGSDPPRVPLDRAAARAGVGLDVSVGRVEIGLRTLLELRPGDVLRLPTRLDDTLPLGPPAAPPLRCALGESAGRAAVRICPTDRKSA
jgi:hypothetical protein